MKIIKDKHIVDDSWIHLSDNDALNSGDITLSLARWKMEQSNLNNHQGHVGVRITPEDTLTTLSNDLNKIDLIVLDFPAFTDGRLFSHARLLRGRYAFKGEIRAIGNYMLDQIFYLTRVGVNAFELSNEMELHTAVSTMDDFTIRYQDSIA